MREIKFRAWDKEEMFRVVSIAWAYEHSKVKDTIVCGRGGSTVNPILMQYTGLKDKNGVEIYEGDIIRWDGGLAEEVEWLQPIGGYNIGESEAFEVIGNIWENPELVEKER